MFKKLERKDLPVINSWRNNRLSHEGLVGPFRYTSLEDEHKWFDSCPPDTERYAIYTDSNISGVCYLSHICLRSQSCEISIWIGEMSARKSGLASKAINDMLHHCFFDRGLNRVYLDVLQENRLAIRLYERAGFTLEGVLRQACFKNGEFKDLRRYSILKGEWKNAADK